MTPAEVTLARERLGLTQSKLAKLLGVAGYRTVHKWEMGEREISGPAKVLLIALLESTAVRQHFGITSVDC